MTTPDMPPIKCVEPGCTGMLVLRQKPSIWEGGSRWVYLCEHRTHGCKGLLSAHPDGNPVGKPATQEVRTARRHCHKVFDPLWQNPRAAYPDIGTDDFPRFKNMMRNRSYHFMAHKLKMPEPEIHMGKMTDLDLMRRFYAVARDTSPQEIRDWWKSKGKALYGKKKEKTA